MDSSQENHFKDTSGEGDEPTTRADLDGVWSPDESDESSVEDVLDYLTKYDEDLAASGMIPEDDSTEESGQVGYGFPLDPEIFEAEHLEEEQDNGWSNYIRDIRRSLTTIGIADPSSIVKENVMQLRPELLEKLEPLTAECLYFDVARKTHTRLGAYEQVSWRRLVEQAVPDTQPIVDLEVLQLEQRIKALGDLAELGVDANELSKMVQKGSSFDIHKNIVQQNVNRLAFCFEDEPSLRPLVTALKKRTKKVQARSEWDEVPAASFDHIAKLGRRVLELRIDRLNRDRQTSESLEYDNPRRWDSIDEEAYKRRMRRMRVSHNIFTLIVSGQN